MDAAFLINAAQVTGVAIATLVVLYGAKALLLRCADKHVGDRTKNTEGR